MATSGSTSTFTDADPADVDRLGGKGAGLARMTQQGLRVPPGYVIGTDACRSYLAEGSVPAGLADEVLVRLGELEAATGKAFGGGPVPLLLSVRSGAPVSMPGMMDTVLNLGLDRAAAVALAGATGDARFVADLVARFHAMYAETVLGALDPGAGVAGLVEAVDPAGDAGAAYDRIWSACERELADDTGDSVPDDPRAQLMGAIEAVFRSWNTRRARTYRDHHGIPHDLGTAVVVQAMVFGNLSADSGSGVVFTRNPVTGEPGLFGEYLAHSQGEDVVAGTRTPDPVTEALAPAVLEELRGTCLDLERTHGDVLDVEFTVERSVLYFLQVRSAKRTAEAAVRIAADLASEGLPLAQALGHVTPAQIRQVQRPGFDDAEVERAREGERLLTTGIGACPGQVSGELVLDSDRAKQAADAGRRVVLARPVTSPADLHGMIAAQGIVTATGGSTSHAAVVARALGTTCVVGASEMRVDESARTVTVGGRTLREGDEVSLDGASGELFAGGFTTSTPVAATAALGALLGLAAGASGCEVLSRVTLPADVAAAVQAGASGLVTAVDDVLAATGHLDGLVQSLLGDGATGGVDRIADLVAQEFTPLLRAAGDGEVGVRAIDLVADEARELLQQTAVTTRHPELSVPLGRPALIEAQLAGLARAVEDSGGRAAVHLAVRHVSDPAEARALRVLGQGTGIGVGAYLTSPRGALAAGAVAEAGDVLWLEVRAVQAAVFGLPARQLLTAEPLDGYLAQGMLSCDPRTTIDPSVEVLLAGVAGAASSVPRCRVGLRLSGEVSQEAAAQLHAMGFRRFAVDAAETRPLVLALGRAALGV
ncbi:pyruvate, phosphate dikinase [Pseudonocardia sp. KRD-184]|uniref:Pyruvate, phosphate dikinase n=1 Tax=Pseudonocardia oceani TaxID=2792013 RepID=A0ABS6UHQ1_9PSEU|nr:pyruvate, phosphate dikinase [Pseudonocardia oceani]MBW0090275.1 pyruvate, phosphate dikinase [Pseudonocardia oceani]MBW0097481.1 pyruvate, phosphate dikinase [Pseudonocardia oceani]MBW0110110.1 pyruvate, phosphate dikinase [Pseudonocardia oceani]MBW0122261.1 pyruvate, phosphate dikinase [Pseudonocardia oceani]MBW0131769.1 pyruvate, phosphate dikinase [Pseudonocardia oceani]